MQTSRTVFFISDGTGITSETFGQALISQFDIHTHNIRMPFVNTVDKAKQAIWTISDILKRDGQKPIVFTTLADPELIALFRTECPGIWIDMFSTFIRSLEKELGIVSLHRVGRFQDVSKSQEYTDRIDAINYTLEHDDGQTDEGLENADIILIGVSRSGKTPTSLYLAMQYALKVANYPLIPEDFERQQLPQALLSRRKKLFGLSIKAERLAEIREERRPYSRYASLDNCRAEVSMAEAMMRRENIRWLSTTTKSIEEIATTILQEIHPDRLGR